MKTKVSLALVILSFFSARSQDNHYWTQGFGPRSSLLSGAVVAGADDNGALFYNPATLAWISHSDLSLSGNVYKLTHTVVHDGVGEGFNLRSTRFILFPQLTSGLVVFKKNDRLKASFGLITRHFGNEKAFTRMKSVTDVITSVPGDETFTGAFEYESTINEQWGGFGLGYKINDHWSAGGTLFISYRSHKYSFDLLARTVADTGAQYVSSYTNSEDVVLDIFKIILKGGVSYVDGPWKLGLTTTMPSINVLGFAVSAREFSLDDFPDSNGVNHDFLANDRNTKLRGKYKSPFSIALGIDRAIKKARLMLTAEFFTGIKEYEVVPPEPGASVFVSTTNEDQIVESVFLGVKYAARPIVNVAIGYEQQLREKLFLLTGFRTDFSALSEQVDPVGWMVISPTHWDLYHLTVGVLMKKKTSDLSLGLDYSFGREMLPDRYVRFDDPASIYERRQLPPVPTKVTTHGVAIIMGFRYYFKKE